MIVSSTRRAAILRRIIVERLQAGRAAPFPFAAPNERFVAARLLWADRPPHNRHMSPVNAAYRLGLDDVFQ
jgi:hypothetical protein